MHRSSKLSAARIRYRITDCRRGKEMILYLATVWSDDIRKDKGMYNDNSVMAITMKRKSLKEKRPAGCERRSGLPV